MQKKTIEAALATCLVLAAVLSAVNIALIFSNTKNAEKMLEEQAIPATIELTVIAGADCEQCFNIESTVQSIKKANTNITAETTLQFSSAEAKALIQEHTITKLPTVVVTGELDKLQWNQNWQLGKEGEKIISAVYTGINPPYVDVDGKAIGLVTLTHIVDESCEKCADLSALIGVFKQKGVKFTVEDTLDYELSRAQKLITEFNIQKVPAIVVSEDILAYSDLAAIWPKLNATEKNGFFALHAIAPPYRDLKSNKIEGLVNVIYLTDSSCTNCYDVYIHRQVLAGGGIAITKEEIIDARSAPGKDLVKKYKITQVPTVLVSPPASLYPGFLEAWSAIGEVAEDGWFVFRKTDLLGRSQSVAS